MQVIKFALHRGLYLYALGTCPGDRADLMPTLDPNADLLLIGPALGQNGYVAALGMALTFLWRQQVCRVPLTASHRSELSCKGEQIRQEVARATARRQRLRTEPPLLKRVLVNDRSLVPVFPSDLIPPDIAAESKKPAARRRRLRPAPTPLRHLAIWSSSEEESSDGEGEMSDAASDETADTTYSTHTPLPKEADIDRLSLA